MGVRCAYAQLDAGQLHYRYAGDPDNPTLVLLHQTPSTSAMYIPLMTVLAENYYLLAPDTPGFGGSEALAGPCSITGFSRRLLDFLQHLDVDECLLFGHHTGAAIAVQMAVDDPGRFAALALCGPTLLSESQRSTLPALVAPFPPSDDGSHFQQMWQRIGAKDPHAPQSLIQREVLSAIACGDNYQASYRAVCEQDYASQLAVLDCPVLVFAGEQDSLRDAVDPSLALLKNGCTASLPAGAGTYVCEREPGAVAGLLIDFYSGIQEKKHGPE